MEEKNVTKISLSTFFLILAIIAIIVMGVFIYKLNNDKTAEVQKSTELQAQVNSLNGTVSDLQGKINNISNIAQSNENTNNQENKGIEQESLENISEDEMLKLFSESSDMRVTSINKKSDNTFSINVKHYGLVRISKSEYETMKQKGSITIDDVIYEYRTSNDYSSLGIIKSTKDNSKEYYVEKIIDEYGFQSVDNEGYDVPLTKFNKKFQYRVNPDYMIRIYDSKGSQLSYKSLENTDNKWINSSLETFHANISRGPQGKGSEIVITGAE